MKVDRETDSDPDSDQQSDDTQTDQIQHKIKEFRGKIRSKYYWSLCSNHESLFKNVFVTIVSQFIATFNNV